MDVCHLRVSSDICLSILKSGHHVMGAVEREVERGLADIPKGAADVG
jgi:hypothetical protein